MGFSRAHPMGELEATIAAPIEAVRDVVFSIRPGPADLDAGCLLLLHDALRGSSRELGEVTGGPDAWVVTIAGSKIHVHLDARASEVTLHGEWWYGGVWRFQARGDATSVRHEVFNIAPPTSRWIARLMHRGYDRVMRADFDAALARLGPRTGRSRRAHEP